MLTLIAYLPTLQATGFTWDGDGLLDTPIFQPEAMRRIWLTTDMANYWPVTLTSLWIQRQIWSRHPTGCQPSNCRWP